MHLYEPKPLPFSTKYITRGSKDHISCTWVQCATLLKDRPGRPFCFSDRPEKHKRMISCILSGFVEFRSAVSEVSAKQRPGRPSWFFISPKNTNWVEDVKILLPVKFHFIPFSSVKSKMYHDLLSSSPP